MVIDEMTRCEKGKEHNAKGKSFCTCGFVLQELSTEKTKTLEEPTRRVIIHFSGLQWPKGRTRGIAGNCNLVSLDYQTAMQLFRKSLKHHFADYCADRLENDADYKRKCMQENSRTDETMESWDQVASRPFRTATKRFGNQGHIVHTTSGGSNTVPTRHAELGQAHRARMKYDSTQRVTASQTRSVSSHGR